MQHSRPGVRPGPTAAIVIPVFNRVDLTRVCIRSIRHHTPRGAYRLVVVDNGSTDATDELCSRLAGAVVVRNETNLGFAVACNQGAAATDCDVVVFLNNDTWVHQGWLPPLVATMQSRPDTAAVGARLVYPTGRLQHAGVTVDTNDYGILEARNIRVPQPAGETDAVTGACMAVDHDRFDTVGGFDTEYWNGYEDVDLCLKFRNEGWKVRYEPASTVTHLESASGIERWSGVKQNVQRLQEKWLDG